MNFSKSELLEILAEANENQPENRMLDYKTLVAAAYRAETQADSPEEVIALVSSFAKTATSTIYDSSLKFVASCKDLLPTGHPMSEASIEDKIAWAESDPALEESKKSLVAAAVGVYGSGVENMHAWTRLLALSNAGALPKEFLKTVSKLEMEVETSGKQFYGFQI